MEPTRATLQSSTLETAHTPRFCSTCGAPLSPGQQFCEQCGALLQRASPLPDAAALPPATPPPPAPHDNGPSPGAPTPASPDDVIVWSVGVPLINNRFMLKDIALVTVATIVSMQVVLALAGLFVGEGIVTLPWQVYAGIAVVFAVGFLIVALLFYQNRFHQQFAVGPRGIVAETGRKEQAFTRATILAGLLTMTPAAAGAGMLAAAREGQAVPWDNIERVSIHPRQRVITLGSRWRTIVRLYCTAENFAAVTACVEACSSQRAARVRQQAAPAEAASTLRSVAPFIIWAALAVLFGVMTRAWYWAAEDTELIVLIAVPLLIAAGLVGRTGWVLAWPSGALATLALLITLANGGEEYESMFGGTYLMYELDSGDFWLSTAGCVGLIALSLLVIIGFGPYRWRGGGAAEARGLIDTEH